MISADADAVKTRHMLACVFDDIGHDSHGGCRGINIGVSHHIFFEDIVLNGSRK